MKQIHSLFIWAYFITIKGIFLSSCVPGNIIPDPYIVNEDRQKENFYYTPATPNTPLLSEINDLNFNLMYSSLESEVKGAEIQAAYLPWKHVGISCDFSFFNSKNSGSANSKFNRFELASGYVTKFSRGGLFETYAGLGSGKFTNYHYTGSSRINLTHFFIQPAIGYINDRKTIQVAFSSRMTAVNFSVKDTLFNTEREPFSAAQLNSLYDKPFHLMWEPGLIFRFGWETFMFHTSLTFSSDLTNPDLHRTKTNLALGGYLRFNIKGNGTIQMKQ